MELSDLEVFRTVVYEGGINRAAEKLNRVPSNVTSRIQKLENDLGKELFIRDRNRLKISSSGTQLLDYANRLLALADEAVAELNMAQPKGTFKIGAMEAVAATHLAKLLSAYHQQFPQVQLVVESAPTGDLIAKILDGEIDLAFVADPPKDKRLKMVPAFKETLVLVSDQQHKAIRSPEDLGEHPTILGFNPKCAYRTKLQSWVEASNIAAQVIEIGSYHTMLSCAAAGMGIGIIPESVLAVYQNADILRTHKLPAKWAKSNTVLICREDAVGHNTLPFIELISNQ
ncbi:MAG: LysR substrate-binding domain-containing protein [Pseudomonadales bacterium]|nr:LysR substrate-binding domain-containing protein [Pseudomonadales bacterium]